MDRRASGLKKNPGGRENRRDFASVNAGLIFFKRDFASFADRGRCDRRHHQGSGKEKAARDGAREENRGVAAGNKERPPQVLFHHGTQNEP